MIFNRTITDLEIISSPVPLDIQNRLLNQVARRVVIDPMRLERKAVLDVPAEILLSSLRASFEGRCE